MPDVVTHNRMGRSVYKKLPKEIASEIDRSIYRVGLLGPDPYSKYRFFAFPLRHGINMRMVVMHREKTGDFLTELAKHSNSREMFSYLAGFLCHYALDSTTHPFVNRVSEDQGYMHAAMERRIDVLELERIGKKLSDRAITRGFFPPYLPKSMQKDLDTVVKNVYGWEDTWKYLRDSYRHLRLFYCIIEDPSGALDGVLRHVPASARKGKIRSLSYRSHICDDMNFDEFWALKKESVDKAVRFIEAAYAFRKGELSEEAFRKIIGNKMYNGEECLTQKG
jgi:hypothetical protein